MSSVMNLEQAEIIVGEYGKLLSATEPSIYGIAISKLPYSKEDIKSAIQTLILTIDKSDMTIHEGLSQAYVYLAQFIPDEKVIHAKKGQDILEKEKNLSTNSDSNPEELELANQAVQTINSIKSDMENLMNEISLLIP